jgi:hypothetical protein
VGSTSDLEVGWRRGKQGGIYSLVDGGGGAAHQKWRWRGGGSPVGHEVGNNIAMVRSQARLSGEKGEGQDRVRSTRRRANDVPTRNERGGVRYGNEGEKREPTSAPGKEGRTVQGRGECGAMLRPFEHDTRGPRHRRLPQDTP